MMIGGLDLAVAACRTHPVRKEGFEEGVFRS